MDRELDALDVRLLRSLAVHGEMSPRDIDYRRRLDRLELEGYGNWAGESDVGDIGLPMRV